MFAKKADMVASPGDSIIVLKRMVGESPTTYLWTRQKYLPPQMSRLVH